MSMRKAGLVVAMLVLVSESGAAQAAASGMNEVAGLYTISMVNKRALPSQTWKREASDTSCMTTTQNGTLMLDSKGRWAMLVTERDRCTRGTKRWTNADVSTLSTGTYTAEGGNVTLTDASSGATSSAVLVNDRITVSLAGVDPFAGQSATYVLRRQRSTRGR